MMALADRPAPAAGAGRRAARAAPVRLRLAAARHALDRGAAADPGAARRAGPAPQTLDWSLLVEGGNLALLRFVLDFRGARRRPTRAALDAQLQDDAARLERGGRERRWPSSEEPGRAAALAARYAEAFPPPTAPPTARPRRRATSSGCAGSRAGEAERPLRRDVRLYRRDGDAAGPSCGSRSTSSAARMPLSDAVPALENFGFRVLSELPTELGGGRAGTIHDFHARACRRARRPAPLLERARRDRAGDRRGAQRRGRGRRVQPAGRRHRRWPRARPTGCARCYRYLRQTSIAFTIYTVVDALRARAGGDPRR